MLKNKTLLITGDTGSFGSAVLNRFLDANINECCILYAIIKAETISIR